MAQIAKTRIGTSDTASLCDGFALFPVAGKTNAGIAVNSSTNPLFDTSFSLLVLRISAGASVEILAGMCGPGYGFKCDVEGETEEKSLTLDFSEDEVEAGFFLGLGLKAQIGINVKRIDIQWVWDGWNSGIRTSWTDLLVTTARLDIDLIGLLFQLIIFLLEESKKEGTLLQKVENISPKLLETYGLIHGGGGQLAETGELYANPGFALPINIVSKTPLAALDKALSALGGGVALGPTIGFSVPVRAKFTKAILSDATRSAEYPLGKLSEGRVTATTSGTPVESPTSIRVDIDHSPGLDIRLGLFYNMSVLKLLSVGASIDFGLLGLLGLEFKLGTFTNEVSNTIGHERIGKSRGGVANAEADGLTEVILRPPGFEA